MLVEELLFFDFFLLVLPVEPELVVPLVSLPIPEVEPPMLPLLPDVSLPLVLPLPIPGEVVSLPGEPVEPLP